MYYRLRSWLGLLTSIMSAFMVLAFVALLTDSDPKYQDKAGYLIMLVVFLCLSVGSFIFYRGQSRKAKAKTADDMQQEILKLAAVRNGKITPAEVVVKMNIGVDTAKQMLDGLCSKGVAQLHLTEKGSMVYVFDGFLSEEEKDTAKSPLDI